MDLQKAARQLVCEADHLLNHYGFKTGLSGRVPVVMIALFTGSNHGEYHPGQNLIKINENMILNHSWRVVLEVLKHELAHHVAYHCFGGDDHTAHGVPFQMACDALNVEGPARKATGKLSEVEASMEAERKKILDRAKKLVDMSEGTDNVHESALALTRLRELQAKYDLDSWQRNEDLQISTIFVDFGVRKRIPSYSAPLGSLMMDVYKVKAVYGFEYNAKAGISHRGMEFIGTPEALEMVEYAWKFVTRKMREEYAKYEGKRSIAAANAFYRSFIYGIRDNILAQESKPEKVETSDSNAIVLMDQEVAKRAEEYASKRYKTLRKSKFRGGMSDWKASEAGHEAGKNTTLNRGVKQGTETKQIGA